MATQTKTKTRTSTKIALVVLSLSGIALAAGWGIMKTRPTDPNILQPAHTGCVDSDKSANFAVRGSVAAPGGKTADRTDKCTSPTTLTEFYCDSSSATLFSSWTYQCKSCNDGACAQLACTTNADCNDLDMYTTGTCTGGVCAFQKIKKYYELKFDLIPGDTVLTLISGAVKDLPGTEVLNDFFARNENGHVVEAIGVDGKFVDSFNVNLWSNYIISYKLVGENLIDKENLTIRLPYDSNHKSFSVYTYGKKEKIATVDLTSLPAPVAVSAASKSTKVNTQTSTGKKAQAAKVALDGAVTDCGYPKTSVTLPSGFFVNQAGVSESKMQEFSDTMKAYLANLGSGYMQYLPEHSVVADNDYIMANCGPDAIACSGSNGEILVWQDLTPQRGVFVIIEYGSKVKLRGSSFTMDWETIYNATKSLINGRPIWDIIKGGQQDYSKLYPCGDKFFNPQGVVNPIGLADAKHDSATFIAKLGSDPCAFLNYSLDAGTPYAKKLRLLEDYHYISLEQGAFFRDPSKLCSRVNDQLKLPEDKCDTNDGEDVFVNSGPETCTDATTLKEKTCHDGELTERDVACELGCKDGTCKTCTGEYPGELTYYENTQTKTKKTQASAKCEGNTLVKYGCNSANPSQPVEISRETCVYKCATDPVNYAAKCIVAQRGASCSSQDSMDDLICADTWNRMSCQNINGSYIWEISSSCMNIGANRFSDPIKNICIMCYRKSPHDHMSAQCIGEQNPRGTCYPF